MNNTSSSFCLSDCLTTANVVSDNVPKKVDNMMIESLDQIPEDKHVITKQRC